MRRIKVQDREITNGRNKWTVTAIISPGEIKLDLNRFYGNVTDPVGLRQALTNMVQSKPRYQRVMG